MATTPLDALYAEVAEDTIQLQQLEKQRELQQTSEQEARKRRQLAEAGCMQIAAELQQAEHTSHATQESMHDVEDIQLHEIPENNFPLLDFNEDTNNTPSPRLRIDGQPDMTKNVDAATLDRSLRMTLGRRFD